jgi:hypothetical protein
MRLRIAVALELVAGQTWAPLQPGRDCGTHCLDGTVYTEGVRGTAPAASRLSLHARPARLGASAQADSDPVLRISTLPSCERRRGRNRGLDSVARVTPPGNLMPRAALRWLQPSLPWAPGPGRKGEPDPSGETQDGVRAQAVWPVSPPRAATVTSARHMPYRASLSKASQVGLG